MSALVFDRKTSRTNVFHGLHQERRIEVSPWVATILPCASLVAKTNGIPFWKGSQLSEVFRTLIYRIHLLKMCCGKRGLFLADCSVADCGEGCWALNRGFQIYGVLQNNLVGCLKMFTCNSCGLNNRNGTGPQLINILDLTPFSSKKYI